jgi:hypothetical protein
MNADMQHGHEAMTSPETTQFDNFGRCIPGQLVSAAHEKSRRYFKIVQPETDYSAFYERLNTAFDLSEYISCEQFEQRVKAIIAQVENDTALKGMMNGVYVPFILPKADYDDIGHALENKFLPAVNAAFNQSFPNYEFLNHYSENLEAKLSVAEGSRHHQLINEMKNDVVVGIYFPCLLEYSVQAARERVARLPDNCLLAGGYDTAAAFIAAPNLLYREDGYPPLLWLSGLETDSEYAGFHFEAYGYDLTFNRRVHYDHVAEYWASAIVITG